MKLGAALTLTSSMNSVVCAAAGTQATASSRTQARSKPPEFERRPLPGGRHRQRYFQSTHEVWARCYAQTVLLRSNDPLLLNQLARLQSDDDPHVWPAEQFERVASEVERVFERLGLTQLALPLAA